MITRTIYVTCTKEFDWACIELDSIVSQSMFLDMPPLYCYKATVKLETINHVIGFINSTFGGFVKKAYIDKTGKTIKHHDVYCENGYAKAVL